MRRRRYANTKSKNSAWAHLGETVNIGALLLRQRCPTEAPPPHEKHVAGFDFSYDRTARRLGSRATHESFCLSDVEERAAASAGLIHVHRFSGVSALAMSPALNVALWP